MRLSEIIWIGLMAVLYERTHFDSVTDVLFLFVVRLCNAFQIRIMAVIKLDMGDNNN